MTFTRKLWSSFDVWPDSESVHRKQENTQLVELYERTYHWHITMVRVCHINSQITARKPNYYITSIVTHLNIFQQLHEELGKENSRATVRSGVI